MPNSLSPEFPYSAVVCCVCYIYYSKCNDFFFLEGCDVRVLEKPPGGYFTYEEIKEASSFVFS